jgi:DNA polymerase-3 subunit epsilon
VSWHKGPLVAFDLETTGVDPETARIVTACVALIDGSGARPPQVSTWLVNPGIEIPAAAAKIHGITTEHAAEHGRAPEYAIAEIADRLFERDGAPIVAFNACYDLTVLDRELRQHSLGVLGKVFPGLVPVVDPFVLDKAVDRWRNGSRRLADQCAHYGVRIDGAHDASHDALAAARVAWKIAAKYPQIAAMDLAELHALQAEAKREQDASFAAYLRRLAAQAKTADEQIELEQRAAKATGHWPLTPYAGGAVPA